MKTFDRYFIYFGSISVCAFVIIVLLNLFVEEGTTNPVFYIVASFSLLIFTAVMTIIYTSMATEKEVNIPYTNNLEEELIVKTGEYIVKRCGRTEVSVDEEMTIYTYKSRLKKWLTNPITVMRNPNGMTISIPSQYEEGLRKMICSSKQDN